MVFLVFLVFLVPSQEMATFSTKSLHFPGGVPKKPKKTKDFRVLAKARSEESKIPGFVFFGTPPEKCKLLVENVAIS